MSKDWVKTAAKSLDHGALHRALHVPLGQKIPVAEIEAAAKKPGKLGQEARFALRLEHFKHGKGK